MLCARFAINIYFICPVPPHVLMDLVVLPPGHGSSVTDFWGWDAHEAQLRCPDDVSGDIGGWSARRALKRKFYQPTQTMATAGILPFRENSHGRAGNRTRDLMISSQRLWPLDHETGRAIYIHNNIYIAGRRIKCTHLRQPKELLYLQILFISVLELPLHNINLI